MDLNAIYASLTDIFEDVLGVDDVVLTPQTTAADIDGWDSLNHIRLTLAVQNRFGVKFSSSEIGGLKNLGDMVQLIEAKLS